MGSRIFPPSFIFYLLFLDFVIYSNNLARMSVSITSNVDESPFPLQPDPRGLKYCTFPDDTSSLNTKSDDEDIAGGSETDSKGVSSTTSFQTEASLFSHDEAFEYGRHISIGSKRSSIWSEDKENVGPVTRDL